MAHVTDIELIEHVSGHLAAEDSRRVVEHLAACRDCRLRFEEVRLVHERLGDWQVAAPDLDLAEAVTAEARRPPASATPKTLRLRWFWAAARAAAVVLLAAGAGHLAGRFLRAPPQPPPMARQEVVEAMHLDVLGAGSPAGLSRPILALGQTGQEVEP